MVRTNPNMHWIHHQAGMAIQFEWQDEYMESGKTKILESTTILGEIALIGAWIVFCDGRATDSAANGEYWWPVEAFLAVYRKEDGTPTSRHATDEEVALVEEEEEKTSPKRK